MSANSPFVIEPEDLQALLDEPRLRVIDGSWYLPAQNRDARAEFEAGHIPGAVFFDHDQVVDPASPLPHAMPTAAEFARHAGAMGIASDHSIVVYDGPGMFSAPRVWWLLRTMGAHDVRILNGGLDGWRREGRPLETGWPTPDEARFEASLDASSLATLEDVQHIVEDGSAQIADARPHGRFTGEDPEPRQGMRSGHIPGSFNVPAALLSRDGRLKDLDGLASTLRHAGIDPAKPVVTTCGSGITAAVISLALQSLGYHDNRLYDGSWAEWGSRADTPVKQGAGIIDEPASSLRE